jgi:hypothetical protein
MDRAARTWQGNWRAKILSRIREVGFESVTNYLAKFPAMPYMRVAEKLGEDVAAVQVAQVQFEEAKGMRKIREAAIDSLPRDLNYYLKDGWRHGAKNDFDTSSAFAVWATRLDQLSLGLKDTVDAVWAALEKLQPSTGWRPGGGNDPLIQKAFDEGWPLHSRRQIKRQNYCMLCPSCTAVLSLPGPEVNEIVCHHCGEQIELI